MKVRSALVLAALAGPVVSSGADGQALDAVSPKIYTCTAADCGATVLAGRINNGGFSIPPLHTRSIAGSDPWVLTLRLGNNECLRLEVKSQTNDLAMMMIEPGGRIYGNNAGARMTCAGCPIIMLRSTPTPGDYVVILNNTRDPFEETHFVLNVGRYNANNANCPFSTNAMSPP